MSKSDLKFIAFYLPQFHPIPENDQWWGKGFTEWTNVTKAQPLFDGHHQPHLPADLGFYDLRVPDVRRQQVELAREYGIHGFCYYYYWFGGRRILERPLNDFLKDTDLDFPFCICWANENWTRRWDGREHEVLLQQEHTEDSDRAFIRDIIPILKDPRYIRVDGAPLLLIYRADLLREPRRTARIWREVAEREGLPHLHLCAALTFEFSSPDDVGFDSAVEFPPHGFHSVSASGSVTGLKADFTGQIYDYRHSARSVMEKQRPPFRLFRGVCTSWDNTPRRDLAGTVYINSSPEEFEVWLNSAAQDACANQPPEDRFVFINAWNEWAEGAHLEPDRRHGRAYLEAVQRVAAGQAHWKVVMQQLRSGDDLPDSHRDRLLDELSRTLHARDRTLDFLARAPSAHELASCARTAFVPRSHYPHVDLPRRRQGLVYLEAVNGHASRGAINMYRNKTVRLRGWAFCKDTPIQRNSPLFLVLVNRANGQCYFAHIPNRQDRPEVEAHFPKIDAACTRWAGFEAILSLQDVPAGIYELGVIQPVRPIHKRVQFWRRRGPAVAAYFPNTVVVSEPATVMERMTQLDMPLHTSGTDSVSAVRISVPMEADSAFDADRCLSETR